MNLQILCQCDKKQISEGKNACRRLKANKSLSGPCLLHLARRRCLRDWQSCSYPSVMQGISHLFMSGLGRAQSRTAPSHTGTVAQTRRKRICMFIHIFQMVGLGRMGSSHSCEYTDFRFHVCLASRKVLSKGSKYDTLYGVL